MNGPGLGQPASEGGDGAVLHNNLPDLQGGIAGDYFHLTEAQLISLLTDRGVFEPIILIEGAVSDTLANGRISTTRLPNAGTPGIQFKVDLKNFDSNSDIIIEVIGGHSTLVQTLDMDLDYTEVAVGENFNTEPGGVTVNETPVTPGVAFQRFTFQFTIPAAVILAGGSLECQITRDTSGVDTGELHIWQIRAFQEP